MGSSDLCALLQPGEPGDFDGSDGATPTETSAGKETVLLIGGGLGNAVLFSIGQELRANGSRTVYFAGYKKIIDQDTKSKRSKSRRIWYDLVLRRSAGIHAGAGAG